MEVPKQTRIVVALLAPIYLVASCCTVLCLAPQLPTSCEPAAIVTQKGQSTSPQKQLLTQRRHLPLVKQPKLSVDVGLVLMATPPIEEHGFHLTSHTGPRHSGCAFSSPLGRAPPESSHLAL